MKRRHVLAAALSAFLVTACARRPFVETARYTSRDVAGFRVLISPDEAAAPDSTALIAEVEAKLCSFRAAVRRDVYDALRTVAIWIERGPDRGRAMAGYHGAAYV